MTVTVPSIRIRRAGAEDVERLVALLRVLFAIEKDFTFNWSRQRQGLDLMLANDRGCLLVAEAAGLVIGMCSGQLVVSTAEGAPAVLVEDLVVDEDYRGQGAGRQLIDAVAEWGKRLGASRLQLLADPGNKPALDFYRHLGWQATSLVCLRKTEAGG